MKKAVELDPLQAAGLEALGRAAETANRRLEAALKDIEARVGGKIVQWSFAPPQMLVELPDETAAPSRLPPENGHAHAETHEETKA